MFTVLSNTRNSNLYLIAALAIIMVVLLTFAIVPALSTAKPILVPVTGSSEATSDYYQRHPELSGSAVDTTADFYLRHAEWVSNVQSVVVPVTGSTEASDYFLRHSGLSAPVAIIVDMTDYLVRHPELRAPAESNETSDYFLRH